MNNRIYRSRDTKMLSGVCGGIADYFDLDPTIVRLITVVLGIISGMTLLILYILCAVIIPLEPEIGFIRSRHRRYTGGAPIQTSAPETGEPAGKESAPPAEDESMNGGESDGNTAAVMPEAPETMVPEPGSSDTEEIEQEARP